MLPEAFLNRMKDQLGEEYPDYIASLERPRAMWDTTKADS